MPDFGSATPVVKILPPIFAWMGVEGGRPKTRRMTAVSQTATEAQVDAMATALSGLTNAGLIYTQYLGKRKEITVPQVVAYDETHGTSKNLELIFQKEDTLASFTIRVPAPDANLFVNGVTLKDASDATQGARITNALSASLTAMNEGLGAGTQWSYVAGYLDEATQGERRLIPQPSNIEEPPAGTPADGPGEDPTP